MTEKFLNMHRWNPGGHEMRGVRVAESVRSGTDIKPSGIPIKSDELLNGPNAEMTAQPIIKERSLRRLRKTKLIIEGENFANALLSDLIKRNNTATRTLVNCSGEMKIIARLTIMRHETDRETRDFTDPKTGVIREENEQIITAAEHMLIEVDSHGVEQMFGTLVTGL